MQWRIGRLGIGVAAAAAIGIGAIFSTTSEAQQRRPRGNDVIATDEIIFSTVQIVELNGEIVRLDTDDGQLFEFSGSTGDNARGTWRRMAQPVRGNTSGFLQIQQVGGAIFLVDRVDGRTWILRDRGSNSSWQEIRISGRTTDDDA